MAGGGTERGRSWRGALRIAPAHGDALGAPAMNKPNTLCLEKERRREGEHLQIYTTMQTPTSWKERERGGNKRQGATNARSTQRGLFKNGRVVFFVLYFSPLFLSLTRRKGNFRDRQGGELVSSPLFWHVYIYIERERDARRGGRKETRNRDDARGKRFSPYFSIFYNKYILCIV